MPSSACRSLSYHTQAGGRKVAETAWASKGGLRTSCARQLSMRHLRDRAGQVDVQWASTGIDKQHIPISPPSQARRFRHRPRPGRLPPAIGAADLPPTRPPRAGLATSARFYSSAGASQAALATSSASLGWSQGSRSTSPKMQRADNHDGVCWAEQVGRAAVLISARGMCTTFTIPTFKTERK